MELLERTHATEIAHAVRDAAGSAASQAVHAAQKAGDKASDLLIEPRRLVEPLRDVRRKRSTWGRMVQAAQRHPWALAASVVVLIGIVMMAKRDSSRIDIDEVTADADTSNRFRSAA